MMNFVPYCTQFLMYPYPDMVLYNDVLTTPVFLYNSNGHRGVSNANVFCSDCQLF